MSLPYLHRHLAVSFLASVVLTGCALGVGDGKQVAQDGDDLTSKTGHPVTMSWDGFVYVDPNADDGAISAAIKKQAKSALGALRAPEMGLQARDANGAIDASKWQKDTVAIVDPSGSTTGSLLRVRYHYEAPAVVRNARKDGMFQLPLLFGDYVAGASSLSSCMDEATDPDSVWYHFSPNLSACSSAIQSEATAITDATQKLADPVHQIAAVDASRRFVTVRAKIASSAKTPVKYPEYDRLWGFGTDRSMVVVYAFFGVAEDERKSNDDSFIEYARFLRTVRQGMPKLHVVNTEPYATMLDFQVNGQTVNVDYDDIWNWVVDGNGWPAGVSDDATKESLKQQVIDKLAERWIWWDAPVTVSNGSETRDVTVEIRAFWGYEDGSDDIRTHARWRYLEGMWNADLFLYQGHSHFGHGPLEPYDYSSGNFPADRWQSMLINSCLSLNYYDQDFLDMHPGGSKNLDVTVNGLPAYWTNMGEASGHWVTSLLDGTGKSWSDVLGSMIVHPSWAPSGYDPLRAVNGELDNAYDPAKSGAITVTQK